MTMPGKVSATDGALRVGVFGGTFNPIHVAHIQTVSEVKRSFGLDALIVVPAAVPPHKDQRDIAGARDRFAMLLLALSGTPGVVVSDMELRRTGPSYSVDTIGAIRGLLPEDAALYFIIGRDAFLEIDTWYDYPTIFEQVSFIVMRRPQATGGIVDNGIGPMLASQVSADYAFDRTSRAFRHPRLRPVLLFENTEHAISATAIRALIREGASIRGLVPDAVAAYIDRKGLYR
jgi:nicotinate-nucleotide adenylyltransferase